MFVLWDNLENYNKLTMHCTFDDLNIKVKVDTILIESEMEAKAILDLIPILNIKKLVLGATKSTVRYSLHIIQPLF